MTIARRKQVRLDITPFYHCYTRCVRGAFLCGYDKDTQKSYNHRRSWIEDRLLLLAEVFCIEVAGYAVMNNHYHVVVKINQELAQNLTDDEVIERWLVLYRGTDLVRRHRAGELLSESELSLLQATVDQWRDNLSNISRFMGNLNEYIARRANKEDDCRGTFWEKRFSLQAVLDAAALLQTLCYVDLNPVRAKMAKSPEQSKYTSVRRRLRERNTGLMAFNGETDGGHASQIHSLNQLPISFTQYLELLDWTGRQVRSGKRGSVDTSAPPILARLGLAPEAWLKSSNPRMSWRQRALGSAESIKEYCAAIGQRWIWQAT